MVSETPFSPEESRRYARHIVLKGLGGAGQQKLKKASVAVVGAGGLGSPAIAYLAGAGVGRLGIIDPDRVSLSNLHRQVIHPSANIGQRKAESAMGFANALNPYVDIDAVVLEIAADNAVETLKPYDIVLDGTDNLAARRAVAEAAEVLHVPLVSGAVSMFSGQVTVFAPHLGGPPYTSLFPAEANEDAMPSCEVNGILGPVTGVIGTLMAMEAIKLITAIGTPLIGRLMLYDGRDARFSEVTY